jgi:hypothetical protein
MGRGNSVVVMGMAAVMIGIAGGAGYGAYNIASDQSRYNSVPQQQIREASALAWSGSPVGDILQHLHAAKGYVEEHPGAGANIIGGGEALEDAIAAEEAQIAEKIGSMEAELVDGARGVMGGLSVIALGMLTLGLYSAMAGIQELRGRAWYSKRGSQEQKNPVS